MYENKLVFDNVTVIPTFSFMPSGYFESFLSGDVTISILRHNTWIEGSFLIMDLGGESGRGERVIRDDTDKMSWQLPSVLGPVRIVTSSEDASFKNRALLIPTLGIIQVIAKWNSCANSDRTLFMCSHTICLVCCEMTVSLA